MAYFTIKDAKDAFARKQRGRATRRTASQVLAEEVASVRPNERFDVFLSHCMADAELVAGVKTLLEELGYKVYVDWIVDRQLDRSRVTAETANVLRERMRASRSMYFATSESSPDSKWMPWELGYFDGMSQGRIAVLPLVAVEGASFQGQEYLGLYPVVERLPTKDDEVLPFVTLGKGTRTYLDPREFIETGPTSFKRY